MKVATITGPGQLEIIEAAIPEIGPADVLVRMKACGICGADPHALAEGGIPAGRPSTPIGHEPAAEVVEVGVDVTSIAVGDRIVFDPTKVADSITGGGGPQGALSEYVAVRGAVAGENVYVFPEHVPWHVAALCEPIAVARRCVDRTQPKPEHRVVVFGAGPVGLGALLAFKSHGVAHVTVADVQANRLDKALRLGADAVINSAEEDVRTRLVELHGSATDAFGRQGLPGTDIYLDAAGVPAVLETVLAGPKLGAVLGIVAIHRQPVPVDFQMLIPSELTIVHSMGHPSEMALVMKDIAENTDKYAAIVSDVFPYSQLGEAIDLAGRPGATDKVVVEFD
ncbi:zinc-dependent alcohol dehydrogenase [Arthrobacter sp. B2a2-09]|uniref:zinc-dependent alcohol dehydrogenase n=1 Tax=Arthrobacter sp. B2a2-09 TaxID=2952822 RepID=UPI0022CD715A|nr:zinc-binding dehydrogenase [Arthrobacter sp. B2a2-09]MCZ9880595.1 zinc-binding dehydrogenase [Arthrobacter sp. B2a2-09]